LSVCGFFPDFESTLSKCNYSIRTPIKKRLKRRLFETNPPELSISWEIPFLYVSRLAFHFSLQYSPLPKGADHKIAQNFGKLMDCTASSQVVASSTHSKALLTATPLVGWGSEGNNNAYYLMPLLE
jgi:hypothetical protein